MATQVPSKPIDLADILEQFAFQGANEQAAVEKFDTIERDLSTSANTEIDAIQTEAKLKSQIELTTDQILIERAARNKQAAAFFGVNPEAANSIIQEMAAGLLSQKEELKKSALGIKQRQERSFLDDPLTWLYDQFALPQDIAAHNTGVAIMEQDFEVLKKLGEAADAQVARNNAIDANTSAALANLKAQRTLAAATVNAENARQRALAAGVQLGSVRLATSQQAFSNMLQVHSAGTAVQHLQLARANQATNEVMRKLQEQNLEILIEKRKNDAEADKLLQEQLDRATSILGMRRIKTHEYERAPANIKLALFDVMANPNIQEGRLGYDTVDAVENAEKVNAPLTAGLHDIKKVLNNWMAEAKTPDWAALKPADRHTKQQQAILNKIKSEARNIPDSGGLYSAPSMAAVGKIPAAASTTIWQTYFAPQALVDQRAPLKAQSVYDAGIKLLTEKKMPVEQVAAEIAQIYKAIAIDNTQQRDYNRFALPIQNEYRTAVDTGVGIFKGKTIIDLTSEAQLRREFLRTMTQQRMRNEPNPLIPNSQPLMPPLE